MKILPQDVKKLREETQCGMLDCKKALEENNGDYKAAVEYLRKKGLAAVASRSGRVAAEGAIVVHTEDNRGVMVEVNSETDFVARNADFQAVTDAIAQKLCKTDKPLEEALDLPFEEGVTIREAITNLAAKIKENINIRRIRPMSVKKGVIASYIHSAIGPKHGKIGVMVAIESLLLDHARLHDLGKKIAMHIAATKPKSLTVENLSKDLIEEEKVIYQEQAKAQVKASGKSAEFIDKMVEGRIRKFQEEVVLMEQEFVLEPKTKVKDFIEREASFHGTDLVIRDFAYFVLGEGVEKEEKDFAQEVQAQIGQ